MTLHGTFCETLPLKQASGRQDMATITTNFVRRISSPYHSKGSKQLGLCGFHEFAKFVLPDSEQLKRDWCRRLAAYELPGLGTQPCSEQLERGGAHELVITIIRGISIPPVKVVVNNGGLAALCGELSADANPFLWAETDSESRLTP